MVQFKKINHRNMKKKVTETKKDNDAMIPTN